MLLTASLALLDTLELFHSVHLEWQLGIQVMHGPITMLEKHHGMTPPWNLPASRIRRGAGN